MGSGQRFKISTVKFFLGSLFLWQLGIYPCFSQTDETVTQLWTDITLTHQFTTKLSVGGDFGYRGVTDDNWNMFMIRPNVRYRFNPIFNIVGGIGSFNTFSPDVTNVYEFRVFQDFNIRWPDLTIIQIFHRIRFEQRAFFYEQDLENDFYVRGRYLFGAESADFRLFSETKSFYLQAMWEWFQRFDDSPAERFVNQQRIHAALGHRINPRFRYELHYIWQRSRQRSDDGLKISANIFRLRFYYLLQKAPAKVE